MEAAFVARRRLTRAVLVAVSLSFSLVAQLLWPVPGAAAPGRFKQVDTLPLFDPVGAPGRSGWLVLNPVSRRGYQIFEVALPTPANPRTVVQSFDLDTLQPRRRVELAGVPIVGGIGDVVAADSTRNAAEPLHAVDAEGHRLYLALSSPAHDSVSTADLLGASNDGKRSLARFVAIDEDRFDRGAADFAASFREPVGQERYHWYWPVGMKVTRAHVAGGEVGRLLVLYATPTGQGGDHTLVQWGPSGLVFSAAAPMETENNTFGVTAHKQLAVQQVAAAGPPRRLDACSSASIATAGSALQGAHQWGLLATTTAVWTGCQAAPASAVAVRVPLDAAGNLDIEAPTTVYRLGGRVSDVLVDDGGGRLYLRSWGGGHTIHVFDTASTTFTGSVPIKVRDSYATALGVHPVTGRLYVLQQDYEVFQGGTAVPVQGGLQYSDPPGSLVNVRPDLAYPSGYAIRVDPVTNRFFVRFGHQAIHQTPVYPGTSSTTPAPPEQAYRVFVDKAK